jgi:hypothetical protein
MPSSPHPAALATCAVLALVLNVGAIGMASLWNSPIDATPRADKTPNRTTLVLIPAEADAPPAPAPAPAGIDNSSPSDSQHRVKAPLPAPRPALTSDPGTESAHRVVFYTYHEVDNPAFPASDWNLDVDSLDKIGVTRLTFEVLVSADGDVLGCTVLTPDSLDPVVRRDLEDRISKTRMLPAIRAGQLVASMRRIELVVAAAPPVAPSDVPAHRP